MANRRSRYDQIIERIFQKNYQQGDTEVVFGREEIDEAAEELEIPRPKNFGDVIYSFSKLRRPLPDAVSERAPEDRRWIVLPAGRARYRFVAARFEEVVPNRQLWATKIPDSTPGLIQRYALTDEQALLARIRYNRLLDIFTGVTCYSLQSHMRTTVDEFGQVEVDEVYVGVDRGGVQYVFAVEAKGGDERLSVAQLLQVAAASGEKFPSLVSRPIAAAFLGTDVIALFQLQRDGYSLSVVRENHYKLVPPTDLTDEELEAYRQRLVQEA